MHINEYTLLSSRKNVFSVINKREQLKIFKNQKEKNFKFKFKLQISIKQIKNLLKGRGGVKIT